MPPGVISINPRTWLKASRWNNILAEAAPSKSSCAASRVTRSRGPHPTGADDGDSPARRGRMGWRSGRPCNGDPHRLEEREVGFELVVGERRAEAVVLDLLVLEERLEDVLAER